MLNANNCPFSGIFPLHSYSTLDYETDKLKNIRI